MKKLLVLSLLSLFIANSNAQCWVLRWQDDFAGSTLNDANWTPSIGAGYNNELQYYTGRPDNIKVENGVLQLTALKEAYNGHNYTAGRIESRQKVDFTYGRVEARMKLVEGQGLWPAFWLLPTTGNWPEGGEIDIMELLGHEPGKTYGTCHYTVNGQITSPGAFYVLPNGSFADSFHVLAVEWTPDAITWLVDGTAYFTRTKAQIGATNWPFHSDFFIILNLAVGGNWPGNPNSATPFPSTMEVDWVKVYQHNPDIHIQGPTLAEPNTSAMYQLPAWAGASYNWVVSSGGSIVAGQNTASITIHWDTAGEHAVSVTASNDCGTFTTSVPVKVSANLWQNPGFEAGTNHWRFQSGNSATATFQSVSAVAAPDGSNIGRVAVSGIGQNFWDVQLHRTDVAVIKDSTYTFRFCARAESNGPKTQVNFLNPVNYTNYAWQTITLNTDWTAYELQFVAPYTGNLLFTQDFGFGTGIFYSDHYYFGRKSASPAVYNCSSDLLGVDSREATPLALFPNPVDRTLFINLSPWQGKSLKVDFYNVLGQNVLHRRFDAAPGDVEGFDLSGFECGTYWIKVEWGGGVAAIGKVVVMRD